MRSGNSSSSRLRAAFAALIVAVLAGGCASQAYDPAPPRDVPLRTMRFESALSQEDSYRVLHARLSQCLHASSYRVQPRFERDTGRAWIMVVQGLGLDRYSFLGNRFAARFDVHRTDAGSLIEAAISAPELDALAHAAPDWVSTSAQGFRCHQRDGKRADARRASAGLAEPMQVSATPQMRASRRARRELASGAIAALQPLDRAPAMPARLRLALTPLASSDAI